MMKRPARQRALLAAIWGALTVSATFGAPGVVHAENPAEAPYSGSIFTRSTLTGDWGGLRNTLAAKGFTLDLSLTQVEQGVVNGGKNSPWEYGGRGDLTLKVDTGKMGLWPGGFLTAEFEGNFGKGVNRYAGTLSPVNPNQIFPMPDSDELNVPALNFTQFLSPYFGLMAGKFDTSVNGDMNEFAHGKGDTQFLNLAFNLNPALMMTVPYSTLGAGMIIIPTKDPAAALIAVSVLSTEGKADTAGFDTLDGNKLTFIGEARARTSFFGRTGHQLVGFSFSNKDFTSLDQRLDFTLATGRILAKQNSWACFYNFDQYLYEPDQGSGRGVGVFGRFGATDGNPNPVHYFWSLGVGGSGFMASRPHDRFGIGYYSMTINQPRFALPFPFSPILQNEYGMEAYYTLAATPWLLITPDFQFIRPSQRDKVVLVGSLPTKQSIDTATVLGLRLQILF